MKPPAGGVSQVVFGGEEALRTAHVTLAAAQITAVTAARLELVGVEQYRLDYGSTQWN